MIQLEIVFKVATTINTPVTTLKGKTAESSCLQMDSKHVPKSLLQIVNALVRLMVEAEILMKSMGAGGVLTLPVQGSVLLNQFLVIRVLPCNVPSTLPSVPALLQVAVDRHLPPHLPLCSATVCVHPTHNVRQPTPTTSAHLHQLVELTGLQRLAGLDRYHLARFQELAI
jgi:hypothetical protein